DSWNEAATGGKEKGLEAILGAPWDALTPLQSNGFKRDLAAYFSEWDKQHKVTIDPASNGAKAIVEVGTTGWTLPMPIVKDGTEWRFDSIAGFDEMVARELGRNELRAIHTLF